MRKIGQNLINYIKSLSIVRGGIYFDAEERRMVARAIVIGVVVWAVVFTLRIAVKQLFQLNMDLVLASPSVFFVLVPLLIGAAIMAWLATWHATTVYYRDRDDRLRELIDVEGDGLERAIPLYYSSEPSLENTLQGEAGVSVRWQMPTYSLAARKFAATLVTIGSAGSGGLEASVALIGESISAGLCRRPRLLERIPHASQLIDWWTARTPDELQVAQLSGIAAAGATLLGAPFSMAFFATEVMYRRRPLVEKLVYSLIAALIAFFLTDLATLEHPALFEVEKNYVPEIDLQYIGVLFLMSIAIVVVSVYFGRVRARLDNYFRGQFGNIWQRHLVGALLTGAVALLVAIVGAYLGLFEQGEGLWLVLGTGDSVINLALAGQITLATAAVALVAKIFATLATIGTGGSAGLLIPSIFFGTMIATVFAQLFDYEPMVLIVPAMTASLVAIVNAPLAAILLVVEIFGATYMLPAMVALVVAGILSQNNVIYRSQRETFDARQILPGVSVRRVPIPAAWAGFTLVDLDVRRRYELNVIGLVEISTSGGTPRTWLGNTSQVVLAQGDLLVVLGRDEKLDAFEQLAEADALEPPPNARRAAAPDASEDGAME